MINLPEWKLTLCPPLYDTFSKSPTEQTAQVYAKMRELVEAFNTFSEEFNKALNEHINKTQGDISEFKVEVTSIMNEYIKSVDNEISLMHQHLDELLKNYERDVEAQTRAIIQEALNEGILTITEVYDEETEALNFIIGGNV